MKIKIAVVTGGAGFIGSHMVDLLISKKYRVHVNISLMPAGMDADWKVKLGGVH